MGIDCSTTKAEPTSETIALISLRREEDVDLLTLEAGENRLNGPFLDEFEAALLRVESGDAKALVSVGSGRFYSTGLDLAWLAGDGRAEAADFVFRLQRLFARILLFPIPTVAALNGHAFAGGAMLALAHDARIMRADRGFFCLPEIDLATGQSLTPGMTALIGSRVPPQSFHEAIISGRRYGGADACKRGFVEQSCREEDLLATACARAKRLSGHDRETVTSMKRSAWGDIVDALLDTAPNSGGSPPTPNP